MKLRLEVTVSVGSSFTFEYGGSLLRIGRAPENELVLDGGAGQPVSWNHAFIELGPGGAYLKDLQSTNGTLINDKRVVDRIGLKMGDQIQLGHTGPLLKIVELSLAATASTDSLTPASSEKSPQAQVRDSSEHSSTADTADRMPPPAKTDAGQEISRMPGAAQPFFAALKAMHHNRVLWVFVVILFGALLIWLSNRNPQPAKEETKTSVDHPGQPADPPVLTVKLPDKENPALKDGPQATGAQAKNQPVITQNVATEDAPGNGLPNTERREIGRYVAWDKAPSVLLQRQRDPYPWARLRANNRVSSGNYLVSLPGYRSQVYLDSAIRLVLCGNVPEFSGFPPALESVVMLHPPAAGLDADCTLDRGRIVLSNDKPAGPAEIRIRFHQEIWDLTIPDRATEVALELWGLYPGEVSFSREKEPGSQGPLACLGLFVKGRASVTLRNQRIDLPNLSQFTWSSTNAVPVGPQTLPQLPAWWTDKIDPGNAAVGNMMVALTDLRQDLEKNDAVLDAILTRARESDYAALRVLAVLCLGALDDMPHLVDALEDRQNPEVRGTAAVALRHWTSRNADNDLELYRTLYEKKGYSREKAEIIMRLLHSFSEAELNNPGTYQTLIGYLNHDNLAIRDLAFWHLYQLVPEGAKQIPYDAADAPDKRRQVIEQWKRLIPEGRLPPGINVRGAK